MKKSKYRNEKTNGYASKKEARRAYELEVFEKIGEIRNLRKQVRYQLLPSQKCPITGKTLERPVHYIADFEYESGLTGLKITEDAKGKRTTDYVIKRKLMLWIHGIRIKEV